MRRHRRRDVHALPLLQVRYADDGVRGEAADAIEVRNVSGYIWRELISRFFAPSLVQHFLRLYLSEYGELVQRQLARHLLRGPHLQAVVLVEPVVPGMGVKLMQESG